MFPYETSAFAKGAYKKIAHEFRHNLTFSQYPLRES